MGAIYFTFSIPFGFDAKEWPTAAGIIFCIIGVIFLLSIPHAVQLNKQKQTEDDEDDEDYDPGDIMINS
jgi:hypothetical protein